MESSLSQYPISSWNWWKKSEIKERKQFVKKKKEEKKKPSTNRDSKSRGSLLLKQKGTPGYEHTHTHILHITANKQIETLQARKKKTSVFVCYFLFFLALSPRQTIDWRQAITKWKSTMAGLKSSLWEEISVQYNNNNRIILFAFQNTKQPNILLKSKC